VSVQVRPCANDEEGASLTQSWQAREIEIAAIHDLDGAPYWERQIEGANVVQPAVREVDGARDDVALNGQGVCLRGGLGQTQVRSWLQRKAPVDGGSTGQLRERHRSVLLGTARRSNPRVTTTVTHSNPRKGAPRRETHRLGESP
jgi:hypothetical protein